MFAPASVHLDENRFNGTLPSALGACTMLRDLRFEYNNFHGNIPTQLGRLNWLSKLLVLCFQGTKIQLISRLAVQLFTVSMSIEGNSFSGEMPQEVCSLRSKPGMLDLLSATCTAMVDDDREKEGELFVRPDDLLCAVPACCTSCKPSV